jgi:hypothetical protein
VAVGGVAGPAQAVAVPARAGRGAGPALVGVSADPRSRVAPPVADDAPMAPRRLRRARAVFGAALLLGSRPDGGYGAGCEARSSRSRSSGSCPRRCCHY